MQRLFVFVTFQDFPLRMQLIPSLKEDIQLQATTDAHVKSTLSKQKAMYLF